MKSAGEPRLSESQVASGSDKIQKMYGLVQGVLSESEPHGPSHLCRCYYSANVLIASASAALPLARGPLPFAAHGPQQLGGSPSSRSSLISQAQESYKSGALIMSS